MSFKSRIVLTSLLLAFNHAVVAEEVRSTLQDQKLVAVTIYNSNLALVKDQRSIHLNSGANLLAFRDVSARMRPETALLRSLTSAGALKVVEQNFDFDLLTPQALLEKYVGKSVTVIRTHPTTGAETSEIAQVLAANNGVVLQIGNRIETGIPGRMVFSEVPKNLRDRPTLVMQLDNQGAAQQDVELSYLTSGLSWRADYVAELNATDDKLDLSGWVTLTNNSGASYRNAKLQLVAGDVNEVRPERVYAAAPVMAMRDAAPKMREETLLEYHLYTLDRATTIAEQQTKQVALLSAAAVPVRKELLLRGSEYYYQSSYGDLGQKMKLGIFIEFDNRVANHLGIPLPKGVVRVYKKDGSGNAQFVGEDNIDHTPKNEKVRLKLGEAFDVTADKKQTDFKKIDSKNNGIYETQYEIVLKNAKSEAVMVTVQEPIPGDWKMLRCSHPYEKSTSHTAVWRINVPADGQATLTYRVLVKY